MNTKLPAEEGKIDTDWLLKLRQVGTRGVHMKGVLPWLVRCARYAGTRDFCPALAALVSPEQNIIFLAAHFFTLGVPIAQQPRKAVVLGRLSLWAKLTPCPPPPILGRQSCWVACLSGKTYSLSPGLHQSWADSRAGSPVSPCLWENLLPVPLHQSWADSRAGSPVSPCL